MDANRADWSIHLTYRAVYTDMRTSKLRTRMAATALIATLVAGCGPEKLARSDAEGFRQQEAQFRYAAREMYESLFEPSCEPLPGFSRDAMLSDERQEVGSFEELLRGPPGSEHIGIAKADAALEHGCWLDDEPQIALTHVNITKDEVRGRLEEMRVLAATLHPLRLTPDSVSAGGEFRLGVRRLIGAVEAQCPFVAGVTNDQVLTSARERVSEFERRLYGSEFAPQFDVAKADAEFERSTTVSTCLPPEVRELELAREESLRNVERQISALDAIMGR